MRHIIPISGKDSLATALVQTARQPEYNYEYVYNPTGLELPEVLDWLVMVEAHLGKKIHRVGRDLGEIIEEMNYFLPSQRSRYCTRMAKIEPLEQWIGGDECKVYFGIRHDENRGGYNNNKTPNIEPVYPLKDLQIGLNGVYIIVNNAQLKPPTFFWQKLHDKVVRKLGFDPKDQLSEHVFDMLFAGRSRANCDRCFNQRQYEWVWLLEQHPAIYWEASEWETKGSENYQRTPSTELMGLFTEEILAGLTVDSMEGKFTWDSNGITLKEKAERAHKILEDRANKVAKSINNMVQKQLFKDESANEEIDILALTSCGLFCGK